MAGGAGSGKSNVVKQLDLEGQGFKIVNSDISLEWLKKNHGLPENMNDLTREQRSTLGTLQHQARGIAKRINGDLAIVDKRRDKANESEVMNIIGNIKGRDCIIVDDIVDTAGTLCNAAKALKDSGAMEIYSYIAHGVLSGEALNRIENSAIKELVLTDSIEASNEVKNTKNIRHISIAPLMGEAIKRINSDSSVSALFD